MRGGWANAIIKPNPSVTADVPRGSISIGSKTLLIKELLSVANAQAAGVATINDRKTVRIAFPNEIPIDVAGLT